MTTMLRNFKGAMSMHNKRIFSTSFSGLGRRNIPITENAQ